MNDKVYANYLMHGRTKGSRNGISTTKGYTAVGQKAKGKLINGKYVYGAGVNLPTNFNGLDNYMNVANSNKTQPYLHSLYPKSYANASDAMKNDPRYSSDSVYYVSYKGSVLNPKPATKNDPDAKTLRDYIGRLYVTNKQSVAANVAKVGKYKMALNKDDDPQYLGSKELSDINKNLMLKRIDDAVASELKAKKVEAIKAKTVAGAQNNWQQQAASQQYKDQQKRSAYADTLAKGAAMGDAAKAAEARNQTLARANAKNLAAQGASNSWQQQANAKRDDVETYRRYKNNAIGGIAIKDKTGGVDVMYHPEAGYTAIKTIKEGAASKGSKNNWQQQANKAASRPTAGKQTNIGASQSADLARWAQQNRNNIAASKKAALKEELHRNAALSKYTTKDWQNRANIARANNEVRNKVVSGESNKGYTPYAEPGRVSNGIANEKTRNLIRLENLQNRVYAEQNKKAQEATEKAKQSASYNKMSSTQKNAMQNDPRYTSNKPGPLFTSRDPKYGYSGKNDSRAPVFKEATYIDLYGNKTGGKETKMDRDPYFESWSKATNKQETAKAQAGNKAFMNAFEESKKRNSRSDIGNAVADAKEDAKNAFKALKKKFKKKKK